MEETIENINEIEIKGKFKIDKKYCFCCNKMIDIYFFLTNDKLLFYYDQKKRKLYREILINLVLSINHRFRKQNDKNKLSIYYLEKENSLIIKEFKLKAKSEDEMKKWISFLNKKIKPKRVTFPIFSNNYVNSSNIFNFKNESNFYIALCNLEYILLKNKFKYIFEIYRKIPKNHNVTNSYNETELLNEKNL